MPKMTSNNNMKTQLSYKTIKWILPYVQKTWWQELGKMWVTSVKDSFVWLHLLNYEIWCWREQTEGREDLTSPGGQKRKQFYMNIVKQQKKILQ